MLHFYISITHHVFHAPSKCIYSKQGERNSQCCISPLSPSRHALFNLNSFDEKGAKIKTPLNVAGGGGGG